MVVVFPGEDWAKGCGGGGAAVWRRVVLTLYHRWLLHGGHLKVRMPDSTLRVPKHQIKNKSSQTEHVPPEHTAPVTMGKKKENKSRRRAEDEERCEHRMRREEGGEGGGRGNYNRFPKIK